MYISIKKVFSIFPISAKSRQLMSIKSLYKCRHHELRSLRHRLFDIYKYHDEANMFTNFYHMETHNTIEVEREILFESSSNSFRLDGIRLEPIMHTHNDKDGRTSPQLLHFLSGTETPRRFLQLQLVLQQGWLPLHLINQFVEKGKLKTSKE